MKGNSRIEIWPDGSQVIGEREAFEPCREEGHFVTRSGEGAHDDIRRHKADDPFDGCVITKPRRVYSSLNCY
jgi:hypothetical protein